MGCPPKGSLLEKIFVSLPVGVHSVIGTEVGGQKEWRYMEAMSIQYGGWPCRGHDGI